MKPWRLRGERYDNSNLLFSAFWICLACLILAWMILLLVFASQRPVEPGSRCYKSERHSERIGTDGHTYECERDGLFSGYHWNLED
jgi:hypothetical protein